MLLVGKVSNTLMVTKMVKKLNLILLPKMSSYRKKFYTRCMSFLKKHVNHSKNI